ncbi:hypothetical protein Patl1_37061 [Pistacia atlantica]|nr:hypothetical protein Patl1_37061 [Pistacia atlantica]
MDSLRSSGKVEAMETQDDDSHRRRFENLMRLIESSCPSLLLRRKEIERHFSKLTHIPDHPPYAYMIQRAISELNELGGSSEETISKFIEAEYEDLPFAHASLLTHHLQKLVKKGDIVCTSGNCYILTNESSDFRCNLNKEQKHLRRRCQKGRQHKVKGVESQKQKKIEESQEKTQVNGTICKGIEEQKPVVGHIGPTGEQENKGYAELIEKHNEVEEIQFKVNDEQVGAEQYNKGIDEHTQKQVQQKQHQKEMNLQQVQVLGKTSEVFVEENNQAEDKNQAENHNGVAEGHKELDKEVIEEQQIQVPVEGYIGPIGEQQNEGNAKLIEEHNELEEIQFKVNDEQVEAEQYNEGNEEHNQKEEQQKQQQKEMNLQQIQVLGKTSEVLVEENSQAEDRNQAESHTVVAEAEHLKELDKEVMEEQFHEEQKSEKLEEKNKIQDQESKASKKQVQLPEIQIEGVVERINPKFSGEANIFEPKAGQSYLVGLIEHFHKLRRGSPEKPPESQQVTSSLNVLQELSLEHQHQTTFSNETKVLEYKVAIVLASINFLAKALFNSKDFSNTVVTNYNIDDWPQQPPENSMEGSLTEQELTAVEHQLQPRRQMPSDRTPGDQLNAGGNTSVAKQMQKQRQQRRPRPSECEPVLVTIEAVHDLTLASLKSELKQKSMPSTKKNARTKTKDTG